MTLTEPPAEEAATPAYPFPSQCPFRQAPEIGRLRRESPVARVRLPNGTPAFLVTSYRHARMVLDHERFSRRPARERAAATRGPGQAAFDFGLAVADPADHKRWRRRTNQVFTPRQAESMRPVIGRIVGELLDGVEAVGAPADLMDRVAFALPLRTLFHLFEVPDDLRPAFHAWAGTLRLPDTSMEAFGAAMAGLHGAATELVARRRAVPGADDPLAELIRLHEGQSDEMVAASVLLLTVAGYETVATQLGNGLLALFQHPAEFDRLRAGEVTVAAAVEEILRYAQASTGFSGMLFATCDVEIDDLVVPAGSPVIVSIESAGRDEQRVPNPERFDPSRGTAANHLAFGSGAHFCLGAPLARVELQEALAGLIARFPKLVLVREAAEVPITSNRFNRLPAELLVTW